MLDKNTIVGLLKHYFSRDFPMLVYKRDTSVSAITLMDVTEWEQDARRRVEETLVKHVEVHGGTQSCSPELK